VKRKSPKFSFAALSTPIKTLISPYKQKGFIVPGPGSYRPVETFGRYEAYEISVKRLNEIDINKKEEKEHQE